MILRWIPRQPSQRRSCRRSPPSTWMNCPNMGRARIRWWSNRHRVRCPRRSSSRSRPPNCSHSARWNAICQTPTTSGRSPCRLDPGCRRRRPPGHRLRCRRTLICVPRCHRPPDPVRVRVVIRRRRQCRDDRLARVSVPPPGRSPARPRLVQVDNPAWSRPRSSWDWSRRTLSRPARRNRNPLPSRSCRRRRKWHRDPRPPWPPGSQRPLPRPAR